MDFTDIDKAMRKVAMLKEAMEKAYEAAQAASENHNSAWAAYRRAQLELDKMIANAIEERKA